MDHNTNQGKNARTQILEHLFERQDVEYAKFQAKLMPTVDPETVIGVRTPLLRAYARELTKVDKKADLQEIQKQQEVCENFLASLPHAYFDENQLHAFIISLDKDFDTCIAKVEQFLPYIDNWATCDQLSPKVFRKYKTELLPYIQKWLASNETYTIRFAIKMLMEHYLDDAFDTCYPDLVATVRSEEYYINMMIAWYFATALAKQYDSILPYLQEHRLDRWCHNKTIQKAIESYRITAEQKTYLRTLKK